MGLIGAFIIDDIVQFTDENEDTTEIQKDGSISSKF